MELWRGLEGKRCLGLRMRGCAVLGWGWRGRFVGRWVWGDGIWGKGGDDAKGGSTWDDVDRMGGMQYK